MVSVAIATKTINCNRTMSKMTNCQTAGSVSQFNCRKSSHSDSQMASMKKFRKLKKAYGKVSYEGQSKSFEPNLCTEEID